jgi:MFS family permease
MRKAFTAFLAALVVAGTLVVTVSDAEAQRWRGRRGGAVAAGVIGGLAAGAIIGGALATRPAYADPYYAPAPVYVAPQPRCWTERQQVWDPYYGVYRVQRVRVCQ